MNNSFEPTATRSVKALDDLRRLCTDFARQEEQLNRELRQQRHGLEQQHQAQNQKLHDDLEAQSNLLREQRDQAIHTIAKRYDQRRQRIQRAHQDAVRFMPRRIRQVRENWLGRLQMQAHRLQQKLATDLEDAKNTHEELSAQLSTQHKILAKAVRTTHRSLAGSRSLSQKLALRLRSDPPTASSLQTAVLQETLDQITSQLREFKGHSIPAFFSRLPLPGAILIVLLLAATLAYNLGFTPGAFMTSALIGIGLSIALLVLHHSAFKSVRTQALTLINTLGKAKDLHSASASFLAAKFQRDHDQLEQQHNDAVSAIESQRARVEEVETRFKTRAKDKLENQLPRLQHKIDHAQHTRTAGVVSSISIRQRQANQNAISLARELQLTQQAELTRFNADETHRRQDLLTRWQNALSPIRHEIATLHLHPSVAGVSWDDAGIDQWTPSRTFSNAIRIGVLHLDLKSHPRPLNPQLALPADTPPEIPLSLTFPTQGSLLIENSHTAAPPITDLLNHLILRLFSTLPPGKIAATIIDPVGLGKNFAGLMHLADYEETLINRRIWTQRDQIEERLAELNEHIEKVIQMYLRNEYASITEYNQSAGSVAEKYHFLVIADFPEAFSETAVRRLQSIAVSGPRCGVYTFIHWDKRTPAPDGFMPDELRLGSIVLRQEKDKFTLQRPANTPNAILTLDPPPSNELATRLIHKIGQASIDSNRVEVPFSQIAPAESDFWTLDTTHELRIPIGRTGATKLQYLAIGKGTRQHALFAGKTGSGKSTLFHVIITNLALACSPDQVEFYLIDFKKGVEFKCYATKQLPHARVVAIESDREFALSVLQRVDEELKRRGDLFRKLGAQDLAGYKRNGGIEAIPRTLLIIDEFQEFYTEDDPIAQTASVLFDRIVRQGRAFGIHVLLGSQTLGGAYTLARATLGQMVIRVALQCNEADAYLIMDENNAAPRLLTRPGEGIYNDASGALEGNSPFQVVWLPDEERDRWLDKIQAFSRQHRDHHAVPIVFEGNSPADIRENHLFNRLLITPPRQIPSAPRIWLGAPNAIKGPTEAIFHRQSGSHLLIVGQREEAALTMLGLGLLALSAQHPEGSARFCFLHSLPPDSPDLAFLEAVFARVPHPLTLARPHQLGPVLSELADELKHRHEANDPSTSPLFLFIHQLHKFKKLRPEDDFSFSLSDDDSGASSAAQLTEIITQGSAHGIHLLTSVDTCNNVNRFLNRKTLSEFEMRVIFQMSANDSSTLIDTPKASNLGLHLALLHNEQQGALETFRPYARPDLAWFDAITPVAEEAACGLP